MWRKVEKMNLISYTSGNLAFVMYLMEMGKSPEEINEIFKNIGRRIADGIFDDFMSKVKRVPENPDDVGELINMLLDYSVGQKASDIEVRREEREIVVSCKVRSCKFCLDLESPSPMIFLCSGVAGLIERIIERISRTLRIKEVECRETKCCARGDEYCEFVIRMA
ncbi:MAG: V4R domain-containing protein [Candidatus Baldrarchaeia archaeon]